MDNIGLTGIIPANHFKAIKKQRGSSFLRAEELVNNADDFEIWIQNQKRGEQRTDHHRPSCRRHGTRED